MDQYLPLITGGTGALVVLALWVYAFYSGKIHSDPEFTKLKAENDQLRQENNQLHAALEAERRTVNETASAGTVTNQLITALAAIASEKALPPKPARRGKPASTPGLTAEDVGL